MGLNYLSILVAAVAGFGAGMVWYSPLVFGKVWMKEAGMTPEQIAANKKQEGMGMMMAGQFLALLVSAYVIARFVGRGDVVEGLVVGFWAWLGFSAMTLVGQLVWEKKGWTWFWVNAGSNLPAYLAMGAILGAWH